MLKYWIWLATRKGASLREICQVSRYYSTPEQAYFADADGYRQITALRSITPFLDKDLTSAEEIMEICRRKDIRILTIQDAGYPKRLRNLEDAPVVLYYKGNLPAPDAPSVGIVGTREASVYGLTQAKKFAYSLSKSGCCVVTGGAAGVDTEAVRGALLGGSPVIVVLGCGVDVDYPKENSGLFREVERNGCLISDFVPGTPPHGYNFPVRNRIISGISLGVLVTEAPAKSGSLITASRALDQGRDVFVLPANVGVDTYAGNLKLLREGAIPVGEPWDILQEYEPQYPHILKKQQVQLPPETEKSTAREYKSEKKVIDKPQAKAYIDITERLDSLKENERKLAKLLLDGPQHIDVLVEKSGISASEALTALTMLEINGVIVRPSARNYELAEK